jgi:hypothetical protein
MPTWLPTAIFVPLVGFGLYRRFKRTFGTQPFTPKRMIARMVLLVLIAVALAATAPTSRDLAAAGAGTVLGVGLAILGLTYTRFALTPEGKTYTPNGWIGLVVTALFVGRLIARLATGMLAAPAASATPGNPFGATPRSPLTLGVFCLMAGYYVFYYGGVLWKGRTLRASELARD